MTKASKPKELIQVPGAPDIPGLTFRRFRGEPDYALMADIIVRTNQADNIEEVFTEADLANMFAHLTNCDPYQDMLFAEIHGELIGYSRVWWREESEGPYIYTAVGLLLPDWRRQGIGTAMLLYNEARMREIAAQHPTEAEKFLQSWAADTEVAVDALLKNQGYKAMRYIFDMHRSLEEPLPEPEIPDGLDVRPVRPEHYRLIWDAMSEAFRDHWGHAPSTEEDYQRWINKPDFDPSLWQVAWEGDQVAGMVLTFINKKENQQYQIKRGWTDPICTRRPWRKRGLARALILKSFQELKALGMEQAALGVDTQNPNGALKLYESVGFETVKNWAVYRKPLS
ncbi:MAG: GNAT family N-acetyltransferase [Anaerolineae bacterium]|nr:GNAT family N-acetyltransferase [Anaerolineae bacterium]